MPEAAVPQQPQVDVEAVIESMVATRLAWEKEEWEKTRNWKPQIAKPEIFNRTKSKYKDWMRKMIIFLRYQKVPEDEKIDILLLYVGGPKVDTWVTNIYDDYYDQNGEQWMLSLLLLKRRMDEQFIDAGVQRQAQAKLENLKMSGTADEFFQEFKKLS